MSARPQTTFANGVNPFAAAPKSSKTAPTNPFTGAPKASKTEKTNPFRHPVTGKPANLKKDGTPRKPRTVVSAESVSLCNDPMVGRKMTYTSKYDALFAQMGNKSALRCESALIGGLSKALITWAKKRYGPMCGVRTTKNYPGDPGYGRVWLLLKEGGAA